MDPTTTLSQADPWLQAWLPQVLERAAGIPVLELGCGSGEDTASLVASGLDVVALDLCADAVAAARRRVPTATFVCQDLRAPLPVDRAGVVVASLSLHYFPWSETVKLVERIHALLPPGGMLLCRLNSTKDQHFGASGHPEIEPNYHLVDGAPKRFFDLDTIDRLFGKGWRRIATEERVTHKYALPKVLWEVILEKSQAAH